MTMRRRWRGVHVEWYPWAPEKYWREYFETGEPPVRDMHVYAEHCNVLAESGNHYGPADGQYNTWNRTHCRKLVPGLTEAERAQAEQVWSGLDQAEFDAMFQTLVTELHTTREHT